MGNSQFRCSEDSLILTSDSQCSKVMRDMRHRVGCDDLMLESTLIELDDHDSISDEAVYDAAIVKIAGKEVVTETINTARSKEEVLEKAESIMTAAGVDAESIANMKACLKRRISFHSSSSVHAQAEVEPEAEREPEKGVSPTSSSNDLAASVGPSPDPSQAPAAQVKPVRRGGLANRKSSNTRSLPKPGEPLSALDAARLRVSSIMARQEAEEKADKKEKRSSSRPQDGRTGSRFDVDDEKLSPKLRSLSNRSDVSWVSKDRSISKLSELSTAASVLSPTDSDRSDPIFERTESPPFQPRRIAMTQMVAEQDTEEMRTAKEKERKAREAVRKAASAERARKKSAEARGASKSRKKK